jgi:hypothetical protein
MRPQPLDLELAFDTEPIVGWRVWRVERGIDRKLTALQLATELLEAERAGETRPVERLFEYRLRSLTQPGHWPPRRRLESRCHGRDGARSPAHEPGPQASCECGVWAFQSRESAEEILQRYAHSTSVLALGRALLWGRIIEQEKGWRAQYAYPVEVVIHGGTAEMANDLVEAYGVPVSLEASPDDDAAAWSAAPAA